MSIWGSPVLLGGSPSTAAWNDNFVVNWDFADPVNRGGAASYTSASDIETIDGWRIQGGTVDLVTGGIRLTRTSGSSSDLYFYQKYRLNVNPFVAKQLTFSVLVDGALHTVTFTMPNTAGIVDDSIMSYGVDNDVTVVYYDSKIYFEFFLRSDSVNHIVNAIKLEVGNAQTLCTQVGGVWVLNKTMVKSEEDAKRLLFVS